jgi:hypothetical protein
MGGGRFREPGNLGQQSAPMPPDMPGLGFPPQPLPGDPSMQPYTGARTPGMYPPQPQPFPGQYDQPYPPVSPGPSQSYPPQPQPYQEPIQQYGNVPYPDPYSQPQQPYPGQYDPQYPASGYPQQGPDLGYGANQPYPPQSVPPDVQKRSAKDETMQQVIQGVFGLMQKGMSSPPPPPAPEQAPSPNPPPCPGSTSGC